MNTSRRQLVLATLALAAARPGGASADDAASQDRVLEWLRVTAQKTFALADGAWLDPSLRRAAETWAEEHLRRLDPLLQAWVDEERRILGPSFHVNELWARMASRWANNVALWSLYTAHQEHDLAWWAAITSPRGCDFLPATNAWEGTLVVVQRLKGAQREALLDGERAALRRWTEPGWPAPPPRPDIDLLAEAQSLIDGIRSGRASLESTPLPPNLAANRFPAEGEGPRRAGGRWLSCMQAAWRARAQQPAGTPPSDELRLALRYALLRSAEYSVPLPDEPVPPPQAHEYPTLARRHAVTGDVVVEVRVDAQDRLQAARVVERRITVEGIRDQRPIAFETLLDAPALAQARRNVPARLAGVAPRTPYTRRVAYAFNLSS